MKILPSKADYRLQPTLVKTEQCQGQASRTAPLASNRLNALCSIRSRPRISIFTVAFRVLIDEPSEKYSVEGSNCTALSYIYKRVTKKDENMRSRPNRNSFFKLTKDVKRKNSLNSTTWSRSVSTKEYRA